MIIKNMPDASKPREKAIEYGIKNLSNSELLAILLRTGYKNTSAIDLANNILNELDNFKNYESIVPQKIANIKGVGLTKSITILAAIELGKRITKQTPQNISLNTSNKIYEYFKNDYDNKQQEELTAILLNNKKKLISYKTIYIGLLNSIYIHPREIYKYAIINSAASIVLIHNHPSGDVTPSLEDINVTKNLYKVGKIIGIPLIDHIIIGNNNYYSFYSEGIKNE